MRMVYVRHDVGNIVFHTGHRLNFHFDNFWRYDDFLWGVIFFKISTRDVFNRRHINLFKMLTSALLAFSFSLTAFSRIKQLPQFVVAVVEPLSLQIGVGLLCCLIQIGERPFIIANGVARNLGNNRYGILLFHMLFFTWYVKILSHVPLTNPWIDILAIAAITSMSLVFLTVLGFAIKKV